MDHWCFKLRVCDPVVHFVSWLQSGHQAFRPFRLGFCHSKVRICCLKRLKLYCGQLKFWLWLSMVDSSWLGFSLNEWEMDDCLFSITWCTSPDICKDEICIQWPNLNPICIKNSRLVGVNVDVSELGIDPLQILSLLLSFELYSAPHVSVQSKLRISILKMKLMKFILTHQWPCVFFCEGSIAGQTKWLGWYWHRARQSRWPRPDS